MSVITSPMCDYHLGGKDNYASDRAAVEAGLKTWPDMAFAMRANRAFLGRAVRYLAGEAGMRQFLDIGTGNSDLGQHAPGRPGGRAGVAGGVRGLRPLKLGLCTRARAGARHHVERP
jgi:S-adenosyl methyltransferase